MMYCSLTRRMALPNAEIGQSAIVEDRKNSKTGTHAAPAVEFQKIMMIDDSKVSSTKVV